MANFMIRFFICNLFISGIIGILLIAKRVFKASLTNRMQYNLWFLLLGLLAVPFIPYWPSKLTPFFSWFNNLNISSFSNDTAAIETAASTDTVVSSNWMSDFTLSVSSKTASVTGLLFGGIWMVGILLMVIFVLKSAYRLYLLKKSALPVQSPAVCGLYLTCLEEARISKNIPIYSTAFLKSPIIVGLFRPSIYLPIHLISDFHAAELRYMLLHELEHYKHKDALASYLMNLAGVIYWFNPFVWIARREMRNDREVACDTGVLQMLAEEDYVNYGNTLINLAEKVSLTPFLFAAGIGGNRKQIHRRIKNIAFYEKPTLSKKLKGLTAFLVTAVLLFGLAPTVSTYAAKADYYSFKNASAAISQQDFSAYFKEYNGSFVLYDLKNDAWCMNDVKRATLRVPPNSTYKIYNALFGLEEGIITPEHSFIAWDNEVYPVAEWNADQTLKSAMEGSVNWYFQTIDEQLGAARVNHYIQKIGYGNENTSDGLSSYWMESSLKISPVEQVEQLIKLYHNSFDFAPENIDAVKDSILLSASNAGTLYGKTGTGRVDNQNVNGWFVGYLKTADNTYFFATNISGDSNVTGSQAAEITKSILSDMNIWLFP